MTGNALTRLAVGAACAFLVAAGSGCSTGRAQSPASATPSQSLVASAPSPAPEAALLEALAKSWRLAAGTSPGGPLTVLADTDVTLNGRGGLQGQTGCNGYSAGYELLADGGFRITDSVTSTAVGCPSPEAGELEAGYLTALNGADHIRLDGEELVLEGESMELRFTAAG